MSEEFWLKVILAIPPTIAALAALRQGRKNGRAAAITKAIAEDAKVIAEDTNAKTQEIKVITKETSAKTEEIHDVTNSNYSKLADELTAANRRIEDMQNLMSLLAEKVQSQKEA